MDNEVAFGGNNSFGNSGFGGGRDFDSGFNRGDTDRVSGVGGAAFSTNQGQVGGSRQNTNGSRQMSDTIIIGNVITFQLKFKNSCKLSYLIFNIYLRTIF